MNHHKLIGTVGPCALYRAEGLGFCIVDQNLEAVAVVGAKTVIEEARQRVAAVTLTGAVELTRVHILAHKALVDAEAFLGGFEDDPSQEGIGALLDKIRVALSHSEACGLAMERLLS